MYDIFEKFTFKFLISNTMIKIIDLLDLADSPTSQCKKNGEKASKWGQGK